jgi:hypothetical protein
LKSTLPKNDSLIPRGDNFQPIGLAKMPTNQKCLFTTFPQVYEIKTL